MARKAVHARAVAYQRGIRHLVAEWLRWACLGNFAVSTWRHYAEAQR